MTDQHGEGTDRPQSERAPQQPQHGQGYGQPPASYPPPGGAYPGGSAGPSGQQPQTSTGNTFSIIGIVCGAIAFLFFPIIFGPAGLILGAIGLSKKEKLAPVALAVAAAGLIGGMIIGAIAFNAAT